MQPNPDPGATPSWPALAVYLIVANSCITIILVYAEWLLGSRLPAPLTWPLLVLLTVALWLLAYRLAQPVLSWYTHYRRPPDAPELIAAARNQLKDTKLYDNETNTVLCVRRHWLVPGCTIQRVPLDSIHEVETDLNLGEPQSNFVVRNYHIVGRRVVTDDQATAVRHNSEGKLERVPQPSATLRQKARSMRTQRELSTAALTPEELTEVAHQLRRAAPVPEHEQHAA